MTKINNGKDESVALTKRGSKDAGTEQARPAAISKANSPNSVRESQSEQWISLFNGKDLTGWQVPTPLMCPPGMTDDSTRWTVQNGVIEGRGTARRGNGRGGGESIQTTQLFHDFHLRFNTMLVQGQNGSVRFAIPAGVELADRARSGRLVSVKIFIVGNDTVQKTGNIMVDGLTKQIAKSDTPPAGTYFSMDIVHNHDTVSVLVNDRPVASYSDPRLDGQGYIMLDASGDAVVRFKDVRIMALKDAGALANPPRQIFSLTPFRHRTLKAALAAMRTGSQARITRTLKAFQLKRPARVDRLLRSYSRARRLKCWSIQSR